MKYIFTAFLLFVLTSSCIKAQDTIVLNDGKKILAQHIHIRQKIYYKNSTTHLKDSIAKSQVNYVIHESGWKIPMIPPPWLPYFVITPGIGLSTMPYLFRSILGDSGSTIQASTPVYTLNVDYDQNSQFSIGIGFAWQSVKINPYTSYNGQLSTYSFNPLFPSVNIHPSPTIFIPNSYFGGSDNTILETITRFNIGVRLLYHIRNDDDEDFYLGTRLGVSFWTDKSIPMGYNSMTNLVAPSVQFVIGVRKRLNDFMGITLEGGIGTPYFANAGISFKVNTKHPTPAHP